MFYKNQGAIFNGLIKFSSLFSVTLYTNIIKIYFISILNCRRFILDYVVVNYYCRIRHLRVYMEV